MEKERAEMIAEVEVQIERALASMTMGDIAMDDGDDEDDSVSGSRPSSRRPSFRTMTPSASVLGDVRATAIAEEEDEEAAPPMEKQDKEKEKEKEKAKVHSKESTSEESDGFDGSAALADGNLSAVDLGISEKSERITRKVEAIQKKVRRVEGKI